MKRKCKICRAPAIFQNSQMAAFCSQECAAQLAIRALEKKRKAETRQRKAALNETVGNCTRRAAEAFHIWIRWRDRDLPCISCGKSGQAVVQWDAGHYRSRGAAPELRFEPLNVHKQCSACNRGSVRYAKANISVMAAYRENLIARIGLEAVEWLEGSHEPKRYRVEELKKIAAYYRKKLRDEQKAAAD
jgi:hypothetical protein